MGELGLVHHSWSASVPNVWCCVAVRSIYNKMGFLAKCSCRAFLIFFLRLREPGHPRVSTRRSASLLSVYFRIEIRAPIRQRIAQAINVQSRIRYGAYALSDINYSLSCDGLEWNELFYTTMDTKKNKEVLKQKQGERSMEYGGRRRVQGVVSIQSC